MKRFKVFIGLTLLCLGLFSVSAFASTTAQSALNLKSTNGQLVKVMHHESAAVSDTKVSNMFNQAKNAVADEKTTQTQLKGKVFADVTTYDYIITDGNQTYFYEESASDEPQFTIVDAVQDNNNDLSNFNQSLTSTDESSLNPVDSTNLTSTLTTSATDPIPDGIGGKMSITQTGSVGSYLGFKLTFPTSTQVSAVNSTHSLYNYSGFEYTPSSGVIGTCSSDIGLDLSNTLGTNGNVSGWRPMLICKKRTTATTTVTYDTSFPSSYMEGTYKNGYQPGTTATMYVWYNYSGKARLKVDGTTLYPTRTGGTTITPTHNITIIETTTSCNITQINRWKVVSTVACSDNIGKNRGIFSDISVDGVAVPTSNIITPVQDHASVSKSGNKVTITVDSSTY